MASIIEGYNYDIFISYRQKDNKGDKWVSRFADALKTELEATFKEDVSVYFDENPHDRLKETHDVEKSLEGKLKCAIFIPILSQTYCDPCSYAWQHEFLAFLQMMKNDHFGKDVRLRNGNVASRILPIRIHDLEQEDIELFEKETGSILRPVDFIFKTAAGVSRPLVSIEDHPNDNLNRIFYRDQMNKVAHAIKEIIAGMKNATAGEEKEQPDEPVKEVREIEGKIDTRKPAGIKSKLLSTVAVLAILIVAAIVSYQKIFKRDTLERLRTSGEKLSVAVMPFQNMTNDTIWNIWQDGIQENVTDYLSNFPEELTVRRTESINDIIQNKGITNSASITTGVARTISQNLNADIFISGNFQHAGNELRINARLIDTRTEEILKTFEIYTLYNEEIIFVVTDSLRKTIANFLIISVLKKDMPPFSEYKITTTSPKAYRYFKNGLKAEYGRDYYSARELYLNALAHDSNFFYAIYRISWTYTSQGLWDKSKEWMQKYYDKRDQMPKRLMIRACRHYAVIFGKPYDEIKYCRELIEMDNQDASAYCHIGDSYMKLFQYDKAIPEYEKSLELCNKMHINFPYSAQLGNAYHLTGQFKKEKTLYKKAEQDFPDDPGIIRRQAILSLSTGKTSGADVYIDKYTSMRKESKVSEGMIAAELASIYSDAGLLDKAEDYCLQALSLEPDNTNVAFIIYTSWFLIDKNRNIDEGLKIADRVLESSPDNWFYLGIKGVGLYKLGKCKEAIDLLEKSNSLRTLYFHPFFVTLEKAKKAVDSQKL